MKYRVYSLGLALCLLGSPAYSQPYRLGQPLITNAITAVPMHAYTCPDGTPAVEITTPVCQEPVEGACTAYWCTDPISNTSFLLPLPFGRLNPDCRQAAMQTEPCSNDVKLGEKFIPSIADLVEVMPMLYPQEYLKTPFLPPDK